jgi:hypothetical protein
MHEGGDPDDVDGLFRGIRSARRSRHRLVPVASIRMRDQKLLWMKSGDRCAFTDCRRPLAIEVEQSGRTSIISQEAHIVAEREYGPRGVSPLDEVERNSYANLILLCLEHHKISDDDPDTFTVDVLLEMKAAHEAWFESLRSPEDTRREARELLMINIIDEWEERADIEHWRGWVSVFLWYRLWIDDEIFDRLHTLSLWIYSRAWPDAYPTLSRVFENFRRVADDLRTAAACALTHRSDLDTGDDQHAREYLPDHKRHDLRHDLSEQDIKESIAEAEWVRDLFGDLALEFSRAANWVLDEVRLVVDPRYQSEIGVLMVEREDGLGSSYYRPRYRPDEIAGEGIPYEGVRAFLLARSGRDETIGSGFNCDAYQRMTPILFANKDEYEDLEHLNESGRATGE